MSANSISDSINNLERRKAIITAISLGSAAAIGLQSPDRSLAQAASGNLPAGDITTAVTVNVPSDLPSIAAALAWSYQRRILGFGSLTIKVANGTYRIPAIIPMHPDGQKIRLIGNQGSPFSCQLHFDATKNQCGILAQNGFSLGLIDGFALVGAGAYAGLASWNDQCYGAGIYACGSGSNIFVGTSIRVSDFYYGIRADKNARIMCLTSPNGYGAEVARAGDIGFFAWGGGYLEANNCKAFTVGHNIVTNPKGQPEHLGAGFGAEMGGSGYFDGSYAAQCLIAGFLSQTGATIWAHDAASENNKINVSNGTVAGVGFLTRQNGIMECGYSKSIGNLVGYAAFEGCFMEITRVVANYNQYDGILARGGKMNGAFPSANYNHGFGFKAIEQSKLSVHGFGGGGNSAGGVFKDETSLILTS